MSRECCFTPTPGRHDALPLPPSLLHSLESPSSRTPTRVRACGGKTQPRAHHPRLGLFGIDEPRSRSSGPTGLRVISSQSGYLAAHLLDPEPFFFARPTAKGTYGARMQLSFSLSPLDKNNTSDSMTRRYRIPRIGLLPYSSGPLVGYLAISPTRLTATCSPLGQLGRAVRQR